MAIGSCKIDSSAVYALFEELKQKIDESGNNAIPDNQTDLTFDIDEIILLIEDLKVHINQQQFSLKQIKNLGQIAAYSINKVNESAGKIFTELKTIIAHLIKRSV